MHSLAPYTIRVFDRLLAGPTDEKYHKLDSIRGKDILDIIKEFADGKTGSYHEVVDDISKKTIKFSNVTRTKRTIYGFIEYGEFGIKGKVINVPTGATVYDKKKDDSDIHQLYFNFTIPSNDTKGVCLFHNIHGRGVKGVIDSLLNDFFKQKFSDLRLQMRPLTYEKAVEDWVKHSQIKELRLTKYKPAGPASDEVDKLAENSSEVIYKPKLKGGSFGSLWDFMETDKRTGKHRGAVDILGEYCASVKAVVDLQGKKRVFSLTADALPVSTIEFDEGDVDMDDGAPRLNSLQKYATDLVEDILSTM